ncbi:Hypoxia up-regulated protein 1 [Acropora cervicornis]|uniref:Hypoxia up-regulated protein 1 n=1 Tax=Acropora cervicornis TaxID=6130 RepID=A0AAD9QST9_ACRCE|nr:Hypoxia up-regulated protein 1 [Acropora cervicornis]
MNPPGPCQAPMLPPAWQMQVWQGGRGSRHWVFYRKDGLAVMSVDLGSQFMKIAIVKPGVPMEIALNHESRRKTPVAVSLRENERLFSDGALTVAVKYPKNSYIFLQDLLGKKINNPLVQQYKKRFPWYNLEEDKERGTVVFRHDSETTYTPEELFGMILNHSRVIGEKFSDHPMKDVVLTVPSFFTQAERRSVMRAAKLVGLNVLQIMNANTAVALHYGVFRRASFNATERFIMFYDMGATSAVATIVGYSTVKTKDRGITETSPQLSIKGVGFDRTLGGHAMEIRLRDHLIKLFKENYKTKEDLSQSPRAMAKFLKEAARVKQVLSANTEIYSQIEGAFEEKDFRAKVTREEFEGMCSDLLDRVSGPIEQALKSSAIPLDEIEAVILVGGGTRVPKVQELLLKAVKKSELGKSVNTDEAAALGAVYQAAELGKGFKVKKFVVKDANVYPVQVTFERVSKADDGTETVKHVKRMLYHRMNVFPQKKVMTFNRHQGDFKFHAGYTDLDFLNEEEQRMDENGFLILDKIESVFEKPAEEKPEEEQSTFAKIGSKISSLFGGSTEEENKEGKVETEDKPTDKGEQKKEDEKKEDEGKKKVDQEKEEKTEEKKGEESEKKEEKKEEKGKAEESADEKKEADKKEDKSSNKTEEVPKKEEEKKPNKPVVVREPLEMVLLLDDVADVSDDAMSSSVKKLKDLQARDDAKFANEQAKNLLESHIFNMRDVYSEKLKKLKERSLDFRFRLREHKARPKALEALKQSLNLSRSFLDWLDKTEKKQIESKLHENPVLVVKDIEAKQGKLDREMLYLLNKAKYYVPKPKVNETASNSTKSGADGKKAKQEKGSKKEEKATDKQEEATSGKSKDSTEDSEKEEEKMGTPEGTKEQQKESEKDEPLPLPSAEEASSSDEPATKAADSTKEKEQSDRSDSKKVANDEL